LTNVTSFCDIPGTDQEIQVADDDKRQEPTTEATDADIAEIVGTHEAGLTDLLTAYDLIEQHYFTAAAASAPTVVATTNTSGE
jgi:hypothetical protein